jgi:hypothetical protein
MLAQSIHFKDTKFGWHVIQARRESEELAEAAKTASAERTKAAIERY